MTTLLRATDSAELLGIVPLLAGFTPRQSLVLLPFHGSRSRAAMRLDLPDAHLRPDEYADLAIGLIARVERVDAIAVVVYCDDPPQHTPDGLLLPIAVQVDELLERAGDAGLRIVDALCVTPSGWSSYLEDEPRLLPLDENAVPDVSDTDVTGDQTSGTDLPAADLTEKERVGRALRDLTRLLDDDCRPSSARRENPQAIAAAAMLDDLTTFFETALNDPEGAQPFATAALLWCMDRPALRDVALTQWASDHRTGDRALDAQLSYAAAGTLVPDDLGELLLGRGPAPDAERLRLALSAVRAAAARAPQTYRRGPLTVAAWLSWALGRSTHAAHYLRLVREIDPEYGLAALVHTLIDAAVLPEWAFRR